MLDAFVTGFLYWLAVGSFVWMLFDPAVITEEIERAYIARRGRLPKRGAVVAGHVGFILGGPLRGAWEIVKLHRAVWR